MKLDVFKSTPDYKASKKPALVETSPASYLAVEGTGAPGGDVYAEKLAALYAMAYTLKFRSKADGRDYTVSKLEGIFGINGQDQAELLDIPKDEWHWRMIIRVPDFIDDARIAAARAQLRDKGKEGDFDGVTLVRIDEGLVGQVLHVGPYADEKPTLMAMHAMAVEQGYEPYRWHHEIYLSDPRRVAPEKLRTILRTPMTRA